ncbi:MAG: helix-turn-helix domain-containing protein [Bacteroidales bacterium]|nr:helix-turn-helix domain-containing protein [Bacteroidales bacterium]
MKRSELLKSEGYWIAKIQTDLYRELRSFMEKNHMNSAQLAKYLNCSKGYVSQLLNGNFDHKISKLVKLSLAMGKVPVLEYKELSSSLHDEESQPVLRTTKACSTRRKTAPVI